MIALLGEVDIDKVQLVDVFATMDGVERVQLISEPYKLASRHSHPEPLTITLGLQPDARPGDDRGPAAGGDGRPVLGGERGPDRRRRPGRGRGRGDGAARRRLQAPHLAAQLPGPGRGGAEAARRSAGGDRPAGGDRGARPARPGRGLPLRGRAADRGAQHAELRPAALRRGDAPSGAAQARAGRQGRGLPARRGVHPGRGQHAGDALRAGDHHLRGQHPLHHGHQRRPGAQAPDAPAGDDRPQPRHRRLPSSSRRWPWRGSRPGPTA